MIRLQCWIMGHRWFTVHRFYGKLATTHCTRCGKKNGK